MQLLPLVSQVCAPWLLSSEHDWADFPCSCPAQLICSCSCTGRSPLAPEMLSVPSLVPLEHRTSFALPSNICLFPTPVCELWGKRVSGERLLVTEEFLVWSMFFSPRFPWVGTGSRGESGRMKQQAGWMVLTDLRNIHSHRGHYNIPPYEASSLLDQTFLGLGECHCTSPHALKSMKECD